MTYVVLPLPPPAVGCVDKNGFLSKDYYDWFVRSQAILKDLKSGVSTVAGLPSAAVAGPGARHFVTDANATTFMTTVAAGGANKVPVVSDGTNWKIG